MTARYLQVSAIPFYRSSHNEVYLDKIWLDELKQQTLYIGPIRVLALQVKQKEQLVGWGPSVTRFQENETLSFAGVPVHPNNPKKGPLFSGDILKARQIMEEEVEQADCVQCSNLFPGRFFLAYAMQYAKKMNKKTIMVVAEDFYDMAYWEWLKPLPMGLTRSKRYLQLKCTDWITRRMLAQATVAFINTPAAVKRYRTASQRSYAIRHPTHSNNEVITLEALQKKMQRVDAKEPLRLSVLARHAPLKGIDFFIEALSLCQSKQIPVIGSIYGSGADTEKLQQQAERQGLNAKLLFKGAVTNRESLQNVMRETDVFFMPHRTNDFGRTFYDAMCGGTPVIAFQSECSEETVYPYRDGLLTPMDNAVGLFHGIEYLHSNRDILQCLMNGARSRALVDTVETWLQFRADIIQQLDTANLG